MIVGFGKTVFVTVGTPTNESGKMNLTYVFDVMRELGKLLKYTEDYKTIVLKSTVLPTTSEKCIQILEEESGKEHWTDFGFVYNPEFMQEGSAIENFLYPDKIVLGASSPKEMYVIEKFYSQIYSNDYLINHLLVTNYVNAEFIKYANNCLLATKISYINELAQLCETVPNADIKVIEQAIGMDKRISPHHLGAGLGYGGSCLSKDADALCSFAHERDDELPLITAVQERNREQRIRVVANFIYPAIGDVRGKKIAILGLAFKPKTDDVRDSPTLDIIKHLLNCGAKIVCHDPKAMENAAKVLPPTVKFVSTPHKALKKADFAVVCTDWDQYKTLQPSTTCPFNSSGIFKSKVSYVSLSITFAISPLIDKT